jgi:hypothetical protein
MSEAVDGGASLDEYGPAAASPYFVLSNSAYEEERESVGLESSMGYEANGSSTERDVLCVFGASPKLSGGMPARSGSLPNSSASKILLQSPGVDPEGEGSNEDVDTREAGNLKPCLGASTEDTEEE